MSFVCHMTYVIKQNKKAADFSPITIEEVNEPIALSRAYYTIAPQPTQVQTSNQPYSEITDVEYKTLQANNTLPVYKGIKITRRNTTFFFVDEENTANKHSAQDPTIRLSFFAHEFPIAIIAKYSQLKAVTSATITSQQKTLTAKMQLIFLLRNSINLQTPPLQNPDLTWWMFKRVQQSNSRMQDNPTLHIGESWEIAEMRRKFQEERRKQDEEAYANNTLPRYQTFYDELCYAKQTTSSANQRLTTLIEQIQTTDSTSDTNAYAKLTAKHLTLARIAQLKAERDSLNPETIAAHNNEILLRMREVKGNSAEANEIRERLALQIKDTYTAKRIAQIDAQIAIENEIISK